MDESWLLNQVASVVPDAPGSVAVTKLWALLSEWAEGFASSRPDVDSARILSPKRGLRHDEAASFLRAVSSGIAVVDGAGFFTLPTVRQKRPPGRYALFSKGGGAVSINLEYLIQVGATAELILDDGWPPEHVGFERGEFDAVVFDECGQIVLAMEAKARTIGPDSLSKLVQAWIRFAADPTVDLGNNAGRKWRELATMCTEGPVTVLLVADGSRWTLEARRIGDRVVVLPGGTKRNPNANGRNEDTMFDATPYDRTFHKSWHDGGRRWVLLARADLRPTAGHLLPRCARRPPVRL